MNFRKKYQIYKNRIDQKILIMLNKMPFQNSYLIKSMKYSIIVGGKRFRPCLIYIIGNIFKADVLSLDIISLAIECIHSYSLIHDDLPCMDNDDFRRNKVSCHIKYGESIALLAGNALQSLAFHILSTDYMPGVSNINRLKMITELSHSIGISGMCIGQALDLETDKIRIKENVLDQINKYKTAFLIRSSVRLAYWCTENHSDFVLSILDSFAMTLGLAFQTQDDIIDMINDFDKISNNKTHKIKNMNKKINISIQVEHCEKKMDILYKKIFSLLNVLKKESFNVSLLKQLIHFIFKIK